MNTSYLGKVKVGLNERVKLISVINLSPESFFKGSIITDEKALEEKVISSINEGADIIDLGGMSTAPYKMTYVTEETELSRIRWALDKIKDMNVRAEISVDTQRSNVMKEALRLGASIINDVSGLSDNKAAKIIKDYGASLILCAAGNPEGAVDPVEFVINSLYTSLKKAIGSGIEANKIVVDPAIGFFRNSRLQYYDWDTTVIANIGKIKKEVKIPILIGVSRKSFIGALTGEEDPNKRLAGSLAAASISVLNGADVIRAHDVAETLKAIKIAEYIRSKTYVF
jgi:dihydropteroate synthase